MLLLQVLTLPVDGAQIGERDTQSLVEESHLPEPGSEGLVVEDGGLEDVGARVEGDGGTAILCRLQLLQVTPGDAQLKRLRIAMPVTAHLDGELAGQGVDH